MAIRIATGRLPAEASPMQEEVTGNLGGLKTSEIKALERLYRRRVAPAEVVSAELAGQLA